MPSDDAQPADLGASDDQFHDSVARPDAETDAETGGLDAESGASKYNLGQPHSSRTQSLEERLAEAERMDPEATQRALQSFRDVIVPRLLLAMDAVRSTIDTAAGLQPMAMAIADIASKTYLISDAWLHHVAQSLSAVASVLHDLPTKIMRAEGPPNWKGLTDEELEAVIVTATSGIPVAWVPRAEILRVLLAADAADQVAVLDAHAADIVDDCAAAVSETRIGAFEDLATFTEEAVLTYRAGQTAASQALSASLIDTFLRITVLEPTKYKYYSQVKAKITEEPDCFPRVVACLPILNALENFDGHSDVPAMFNRHASAHAVYAQQYTPTNALISLMLATSLLRQAHHDAHEAPEENDLV